jgi:hypothetical protein
LLLSLKTKGTLLNEISASKAIKCKKQFSNWGEIYLATLCQSQEDVPDVNK